MYLVSGVYTGLAAMSCRGQGGHVRAVLATLAAHLVAAPPALRLSRPEVASAVLASFRAKNHIYPEVQAMLAAAVCPPRLQVVPGSMDGQQVAVALYG